MKKCKLIQGMTPWIARKKRGGSWQEQPGDKREKTNLLSYPSEQTAYNSSGQLIPLKS